MNNTVLKVYLNIAKLTSNQFVSFKDTHLIHNDNSK